MTPLAIEMKLFRFYPLTVVAPTSIAVKDYTDCNSGWKGFRICGNLDFALVGILAKISSILAENGVSIFALSTYDTDYVLVKAEKLEKSLRILAENGIESR